jgi:RND family efflux transporter MFP subunit
MKVLLSGSLVVLAAILTGCRSDDSARPATVETVQAHVVTSRQQQLPLLIHSTGTLHAKESVTLSAEVPGRVEQVLVHEGDTVKAGQTLVVLDAAALRAQVDQAQAGVKAAESEQAAAQSDARLVQSTLDRYRKLEVEKSVSPQEMDEVTRRAEAAEARLDAVRAQTAQAQAQERSARNLLGFSRVVAPFAGIITARMADPGALAAPGVPLLQIDLAGPLQLHTSVDESVIQSIRKGMSVQIAIDGAPLKIAGSVAEILPAADPASHSFLVKISLPTSIQLRAGLYGAADFPNGTRQAILVPRTAIVTRGSLACAYVLGAQDIAQLRYVTIGSANGDLVEVLSGIASEERLVDAPTDRELAGKRIEAQR